MKWMTGATAPQRTIIFLCPHNAAKSVIAAAYWQRLADQRGWPVWATSAGTDPDPEVSPQVATALLAEGMDVRAHRPRQVTSEALATAWRVVSLGCDLGVLAPTGRAVDHWDDIPAPSSNLAGALDAIAAHVMQFANACAEEIT
jgi:protein-tyrosine-phosphatase